MRGGEDQFRFQFAIERPEEKLDASGIDQVGVHLVVWLEHTGKWRAKKVEIVFFQALPDAGSVRQSYGTIISAPAA